MRRNKVVRVMTSGGFSSLGYAPAMRLRNAVSKENKNGWHVKQVINDDTNNFFISLLRALLLLITLFIWCPASSFIVILEKEIDENIDSQIEDILFCEKCNEPISENLEYCTNCGNKNNI